jgi:DNA invertase Pin-like site-specific DNA recombinase
MHQRNPEQTPRIFGYCRTSNIESFVEKTIKEQEQAIIEFARNKNWEISHFFIDEKRGLPAIRPISHPRETSFQNLIDELRAKDIVVIASVDRFFGSAIQSKIIINRLRRLDVQLAIVDLTDNCTTNGSYKLLISFLESFTQREISKLRSMRRMHVHKSLREEFRFTGGRTEIGFDVEIKDGKKYFKVNENDKKILEEIEELKRKRNEELIKTGRIKSENYTLERIYEILNQKFHIDRNFIKKSDSDDVTMRLQKYSYATLQRLFSNSHPNNVEARLKRIRDYENEINKNEEKRK